MSVKSLIKKGISNYIDTQYKQDVLKDTLSYDLWIQDKEMPLEHMNFDYALDDNQSYVAKLKGLSLRIVPYSLVDDTFKVSSYIEDIIVFVNGKLSDISLPLLADCFITNQNISIAYGDEDIAGPERSNPFFKPDWSPNTFIDHFYFCNLVAIRRSEFRDFDWSIGYKGASSIYHTLLRYLFSFEKNLIKVYHIGEILIHVNDYTNNYIKDASVEHLVERLYVDYQDKKNGNIGEANELLSIIIPSKDNPHLLRPCLASLFNTSHDGIDLDIIVVDNGSSEENLEKINVLKEEFGFRHIYEPMDFNFAKMCNMGAALANGKYLLFLNDDVTLFESKTLNTLLREVKFRFSGAVGAKLLYPGGDKIQHAGVFNNRIGPVHKFQFMDAKTSHYYGFAGCVNNVISVTGACLMVRKDVYDSVGGMNEKLKVAFNDIDLCFRIFEKGYVNVVCNNVALIHAESITRGKDTSETSLKRLLNEKDKLYSDHPSLASYDPFYNKYLINDSLDTRIVPASEYEYEKVVEEIPLFEEWNLSGGRLEPCLQVGIEYSGMLSSYTYVATELEDYYIQGYAFVTGSDNALYKKSIILQNEAGEAIYKAPFNGSIRTDVAINVSDQINVERSGFSLFIKEGLLPKGSYRIGILFENMIAREKLYKMTNNFLYVNTKIMS